ncbi:MAG: FKBP-type peptidyl-prolyl cis-trans isomerase [Bacteroidia bacterium]|nr:FKBP-type peptidyl-prolyl cis-trans isomerase [Bacteroidia bacterium]
MAWLVYSCNKDGFSITGSGLKYHLIEQKGGRKPLPGEMMRLHLVYKDKEGRELYNSGVLGDAFVLELTAPTFKGGLEEGFAMMGEGDSAAFLVPADSVFDKTFKQVLPAGIRKGDLLRFEVRMKKVMSVKEFRDEDRTTAKKNNEAEQRAIEFYLGNNNMNVQPVKPGVYYISFREGKGEKPVQGDSVEIRYTARFLDGQVYDGSAQKGSNLLYMLGDGLRLLAWEEAVASMREGGLSRLVLSSAAAYGSSGRGPVPPDTPVVFDIELVKVYKKGAARHNK